MALRLTDFSYIGRSLEGFFFGLYSGIFAIYLQHHGSHSRKSTYKPNNILFYALWLLYVLSAATGMLDILVVFLVRPDTKIEIVDHLEIIQVTVFACSDFIAQFILIYRCWIVWGYSIRVVIVPSFLAFAFLAISIAAGAAPLSIIQGQILVPAWSNMLALTGLMLPMTVNALVTGLIVFRIFKMFQEVKTPNRILGVSGGNTFRRVMFILIESGMALFSIQLTRLVVSVVLTDAGIETDSLIAAIETNSLIYGIHAMLNGITQTIIFVRVSMGLSFHDESSTVAPSSGSLRFAPNKVPDPIPENAIVDVVMPRFGSVRFSAKNAEPRTGP